MLPVCTTPHAAAQCILSFPVTGALGKTGSYSFRPVNWSGISQRDRRVIPLIKESLYWFLNLLQKSLPLMLIPTGESSHVIREKSLIIHSGRIHPNDAYNLIFVAQNGDVMYTVAEQIQTHHCRLTTMNSIKCFIKKDFGISFCFCPQR